MTTLTPAQLAQQGNRDASGRYREAPGADQGDGALPRPAGEAPDHDALYAAVNDLRREAIRQCQDEERPGGISSWAISDRVDATSWVADFGGQPCLGQPEQDWCADISSDDTVRVFAGGDVVLERVIPGASRLLADIPS